MTTRSFELTDGKSDKFWTITLDGGQYTVKFGRRGTAGQIQNKELGSSDAARQTFDKLVAEKLKKGYKEVGATRNGARQAQAPVPLSRAAIVPAAAKTSPAAQNPPAQPVPRPVSTVTAAPPPEALKLRESTGENACPTCPIRLEPADWMVATWRPRQPVPKPEPLPFDRKAAMALFQRSIGIGIKQQWWWRSWTHMELPASMSWEEARFWFHGVLELTRIIYLQHPNASNPADRLRAPLAEAERSLQQLSALDATQELPLTVADEMIRKGRPSPLLLIPLLNLYPLREAVELLVETSCRTDWSALGDDCLRAKVLQYLSNEDLELLRKAIQRKLPGQSPKPVWNPVGHYDTCSYIFRLATVVGVGAQVTKLVESFPGLLYHAFPYTHRSQDIVFGLPSATLVSQHMRRLKLLLTTPFHIRAWLAHTELAELDLIQRSIVVATNRQEAEELLETFAQAVAAPEAAPVMLTLTLESKAPQVAREWLMEHPSETIAGLAPVAAGKGKLADAAINVLRDLDRTGHGSAIESRLSPEAFQKVAIFRKDGTHAAEHPVLDAASTPAGLAAAFDEATRIKAKLPSWAAPAMLPPIQIAAGRLNDNQTTVALRALANSDLANPHPLLLALRCYATPASLDQFAWALFERWLGDGGTAKEKWSLGAVGLYGGDQSAISLAGLIRVWPGQGKHQMAALGLECLRAIGTDTALIQISGISQRVKFQAIKARAKECMEAIAADLNLTRPQLEDRVVPDCGLDEQGSRVFDFGPRQFRLILGPGLKPLIVDADNQRKPDLPKPNSKDDAAKAEEAVAAWKLVKKQLAEVVKVQTRRLEQALVTQRRWTAAEFESLFLRHPFLMNMSPWLVWGAFDRDGKLALTFRVTEDRSLGDEHDRPINLPPDVTIGVVHPMQLDPASLAAWGELLSDYEILPPFPQLGRPVLRLTDSELGGDTISRHADASIPAASLVGTLERLGWQRAAVGDGGAYDWHGKHFPELGVSAILEHELIFIGMLADSEPTPINACYFTPDECARTSWNHQTDRIPLKKIDPLILSEVLSDLATVASKGTS